MKKAKEFFAVLFSIIICVLVVFVVVKATTTVGNNVSVGGVLSVNGSGTATEFSVLGTASISEDLWASGSFQFGGGESTATVSYSRLGSNTTGHSLADADDLLVSGLLEVDDAVYFDSTASVATSLRVPMLYGNVDAGGYLRIGDEALTSHSLAAEDDLLVTGKLEVDGTAYFDGQVSLSSNGLLLDNGVDILTGTASPQGSTTNCSVGDIYIRTGATLDTTLNICDETNVWTPADL
ncbi:MAG: hypothetical protein ACOZAL_03335 [Patescibacteria group bacterium]